jgi:O-antigen ligase
MNWSSLSKIILALICSSFILVIAITGNRLQKRFNDIADKSNIDRMLSWENGVKLFIQNPLLGIGIHKARDSFYQNTQYPHYQSEFNQLEVHNTFIQIASETGIVGFIVFLILFCWPWYKVYKLKTDEKYFLYSSLIILSLSVLTIGIGYKDLFILHLFLIAALAHCYQRRILYN